MANSMVNLRWTIPRASGVSNLCSFPFDYPFFDFVSAPRHEKELAVKFASEMTLAFAQQPLFILIWETRFPFFGLWKYALRGVYTISTRRNLGEPAVDLQHQIPVPRTFDSIKTFQLGFSCFSVTYGFLLDDNTALGATFGTTLCVLKVATECRLLGFWAPPSVAIVRSLFRRKFFRGNCRKHSGIGSPNALFFRRQFYFRGWHRRGYLCDWDLNRSPLMNRSYCDEYGTYFDTTEFFVTTGNLMKKSCNKFSTVVWLQITTN